MNQADRRDPPVSGSGWRTGEGKGGSGPTGLVGPAQGGLGRDAQQAGQAARVGLRRGLGRLGG